MVECGTLPIGDFKMIDDIVGEFVFRHAGEVVFWFGVFTYVVFAHTISHEIRAEHALKRVELKERENQGEDVCLERMMIDLSLFVCWLFFPIMLLSQWMFCRK